MNRIKSFINIFTKLFSYLIPKKKGRWVFGSWFGNGYRDNSRYLLEYLSKVTSNKELIWIQNCKERPKNLPKNVKFVKYGSLENLKVVITAELLCVSQGFADLYPYALQGNSYMIQLWHGIAWKKIGKDSYEVTKNPIRKLLRNLTEWYSHANLYIAPSKEYAKKMGPALGARDKEILYVGQPRNELLFDSVKINKSKKYILKRYDKCITNNTIIVTYMPTFRNGTTDMKSIAHIINYSKINYLLNSYDILFLQKGHFVNQQKNVLVEENNRVKNVNDIDAEILLAGSDILITDYSSCFFDFLLRDKPIIHYLYDYDYYRLKDRGLYYNIDEVCGGTVCINENELVDAIVEAVLKPEKERKLRGRMKSKFCEYESENNSKYIYERILQDLKKGNQENELFTD